MGQYGPWILNGHHWKHEVTGELVADGLCLQVQDVLGMDGYGSQEDLIEIAKIMSKAGCDPQTAHTVYYSQAKPEPMPAKYGFDPAQPANAPVKPWSHPMAKPKTITASELTAALKKVDEGVKPYNGNDWVLAPDSDVYVNKWTGQQIPHATAVAGTNHPDKPPLMCGLEFVLKNPHLFPGQLAPSETPIFTEEMIEAAKPEPEPLVFVDVNKLARMNTWVWAHNAWHAVMPGRKPKSIVWNGGTAVVSETYPKLKPTGEPIKFPLEDEHPWRKATFIHPQVPAPDKRTWYWNDTIGQWLKLAKGQPAVAANAKATEVVAGCGMKPKVKPSTFHRVGVPHAGWPVKFLQSMTPQPGCDVLGAAVQLATIVVSHGHVLLDDEPSSYALSKLETYDKHDPYPACNHCGDNLAPLSDKPAFRCDDCYENFCVDCFIITTGNCKHCTPCPGCEDDPGEWYCEHCGVPKLCDDCVHEVNWPNAAYVCDSCFADHGPKFVKPLGSGAKARGHMNAPPWEQRGIVVDMKEINKKVLEAARQGEESDRDSRWKEVWGFDDEDHDPIQVAADFYLLHPVQHGSLAPDQDTELRVISEEAAELRHGLIARYDDIFRRYVDMVVGGELRHHRALGRAGKLPGHRPFAWIGWLAIREQVGPDALADAATLFNEFDPEGSYGGPKWAMISEVLHLRETGRISAEVFVDRVFNLEHNGCSVLGGKVAWSGFTKRDLNLIKTVIGPAHAANPARLDILALFASADTQRIWADYVPALNRQRRVRGVPQIRRLPSREREPGSSDGRHSQIYYLASVAQQTGIDVNDCRRIYHEFGSNISYFMAAKKEGKARVYQH